MVVKVFFVINAESERLDKIHSTLKSFDEVVFSCLVESGPYDIISLVEVDTLDDYRALIEKVAALPDTDDFTSFFTVNS
ncbi:MAG: Lrp/AsnC ligand binding domain-containing protein [Candidatus Thorarchaeota archaeon]